jgi:hypothetical protein
MTMAVYTPLPLLRERLRLANAILDDSKRMPEHLFFRRWYGMSLAAAELHFGADRRRTIREIAKRTRS